MSTTKDKKAVKEAIVLASMETKASPLFAKLKKIVEVNSQSDLDLVAEKMKALKEIKKLTMQERDEIVAPIRQSIARIEQLFDPFIDKIDQLEVSSKQLMVAYIDRQTLLAEKIEEDFESGKIKKVETYTDKLADAQVTSGGNFKRLVQKELVIEDESKIPRQYLSPKTAEIKSALLKGIKVLGCKLRTKNNVAI